MDSEVWAVNQLNSAWNKNLALNSSKSGTIGSMKYPFELGSKNSEVWTDSFFNFLLKQEKKGSQRNQFLFFSSDISENMEKWWLLLVLLFSKTFIYRPASFGEALWGFERAPFQVAFYGQIVVKCYRCS